MKLIHSYAGRFATLPCGTVVSHDALAVMEAGLKSQIEEAETGPDAVIQIAAIEEAALLFGLDITVGAGATGDGTEQPTL